MRTLYRCVRRWVDAQEQLQDERNDLRSKVALQQEAMTRLAAQANEAAAERDAALAGEREARAETARLHAALARVEALPSAWLEESDARYYERRNGEDGPAYEGGFQDGWDHAAYLLRAALSPTPPDTADGGADVPE